MRIFHLPAISLLLTMTLASCDKPKRLDAENAQLIQQREQLLKELDDYDQRIRALGSLSGYGSVDMISQRAAEVAARATTAKSAANAKLSHWLKVEERFNSLRNKVDAYKAKNLR